MKVEEKLAFFSKIAAQEAELECSKILNDVDKRMKELIETVTDEAQKQANIRLRNEASKIEQDKNKEILTASTESKKALLNIRNSLLDTLFEDVTVKLREYTQTDAYKSRLIDDIKESAKRFGHVKVCLMERDSSLADGLPDNCECVSVKDDYIGGFKLLITERNAIEDHTYLARLKTVRDDFNELKLTHAMLNGKEADE